MRAITKNNRSTGSKLDDLEIYDCTLREGEQAAGASFDLESRIKLFKILDDFGIEYVELGWPVASKEIFDSFEECKKIRKNAKIVAFGSTSIAGNPGEDNNLNSIIGCGADYACIFGKTWLEHIEKQLKISPEENLRRIETSIKFLKENNMHVFYDAEHFFDAFKDDEDYAIRTLVSAAESGAERLILCDTNGGTMPDEAKRIVEYTKKELIKRGIKTGLGVHFHNDCGLALANSLISLPYIIQVQGTINGIGERIGNLNFSEFLPVYMKKIGGTLDIKLENLKKLNEEAFRLSGLEIPESRAFVGDNAFAHKGGIHIDAKNKGASYEHVVPEDFGNKSVTILNTLGGRSSVVKVAEQFGYCLDKKDPEVQKKITGLFEALKDLEIRGYRIGAIPAEQFLLIEKYFGNLIDFFNIERWDLNTSKNDGKEESEFFVRCILNGAVFEDKTKIEGGPVDAAYKTISKILASKYSLIRELKLSDFHVSIVRGRGEESNVRTAITFENREIFHTVGVDNNIIQSAIEALTKGFKYYLNKVYKSGRE
jgi:2-isopropylmalate synthase